MARQKLAEELEALTLRESQERYARHMDKGPEPLLDKWKAEAAGFFRSFEAAERKAEAMPGDRLTPALLAFLAYMEEHFSSSPAFHSRECQN